jgi:O-antigen/teichoic acid export membrane protein
MAVFVVVGNYILIPTYGINGAALSTLLVVVSFTFIRVAYVYRYFGVQPYDKNVFIAFVLIGLVFGATNLIDFKIHPIASIVLKSILITLVYGVLVTSLNLSETVHLWVKRIIRR